MADEAVLKLKKMYRARMYMDDMRRGIDPVSKLPVSEDSVIRQEKVINCFGFLSELLDELICEFEPKTESPDDLEPEDGGAVPLKPFGMSFDQVSRVMITRKPITVSTFIRNINRVLDRKTTKAIRAKDINGWLTKNGFVEERDIRVVKEDKEYILTPQASVVGLIPDSKPINNGQAERHFVTFTGEAQRFILDNIDDIAEYARNN